VQLDLLLQINMINLATICSST